MAGSLNGLGSGQQIPIANTFQPGQAATQQSRIDDPKRQQQNVTQPRGAASAQTQTVETRTVNPTRGQRSGNIVRANTSAQDQSPARRGSLVDISV